jgi:multiple sugar transport system substrate-binding protein
MKKDEKKPIKHVMSRRDMLKLTASGTTGLFLLAACGQAAPTAAPQEAAAPTAVPQEAAPQEAEVKPTDAPPAPEVATLTVLHRREYFKDMEDIFRNAVVDWAGDNNVEIDVSTVGSEAFEDFVAKLVASVSAGESPDLVYHVRLVQQLYFLEALEPVSDTVEKAISLYGDVPELNRDINIIDGTWWGIPYSVHGSGQFARRSVFEQAGIDPDSMETYDLRREGALAAARPEEEMYPWGVTTNQSGDGTGFITAVIHNWGGSITDADVTKLTFDSPETVAAVEWMTEIYTDEKWAKMLPPGVVSWTDSNNNEAYLAGNIAYTHNAASVYASSKQDAPEIFADTVVLKEAMGPLGQHLSGSSGGQFVIPKGAKNVEGAKSLALHMLQPEIFLPISTISAGLFLPSYKGYYEMDEVKKGFEEDPNLARLGESALGSYPGMPYPAKPSAFFDSIDAQTIVTDMMAQTIVQGVSPADAVKQAADRMAQIAEELQVFS